MTRWLPLLLVGCGGGDPLAIRPEVLDFGEVDFQQELPSAGYDVIELSLENTGGRALEIAFPAFPEARLRLSALFASDGPPTLAPLEPGETQIVQIGVWAYELGERDTEVETEVTVTAGGDTWRIPASYVPIRQIDGGDSGL
ncbi:MAG: hypothetical protein EP330_22535 [Deltaproteobacteria bacterium]|nr:MAG: hypothetical protein EP330_22535 [Deltaproteobacteria bacterium]